MGSTVQSVFDNHHARRFVSDLAVERQLQISLWSHEHDDAHTMGEWSDLIFEYDLKLDDVIYGIRDGYIGVYDFKAGLVKIAALAMSAYEATCRNEEKQREQEARG